MNFIAPLMLVGALGILVPLAIHLIGRRRAKVVRFAALEFLISTRRRTARRLELRERLLLLVRVLVCLAVPLALAKPFTSCESHGLSIVRGPQAAALPYPQPSASNWFAFASSFFAPPEPARDITASSRHPSPSFFAQAAVHALTSAHGAAASHSASNAPVKTR